MKVSFPDWKRTFHRRVGSGNLKCLSFLVGTVSQTGRSGYAKWIGKRNSLTQKENMYKFSSTKAGEKELKVRLEKGPGSRKAAYPGNCMDL